MTDEAARRPRFEPDKPVLRKSMEGGVVPSKPVYIMHILNYSDILNGGGLKKLQIPAVLMRRMFLSAFVHA